MDWQLVAEGTATSLINLPQYEEDLPEGSYNMLELALSLPVTDGVAQELEDALKDAGVMDVKVVNFQNPHLQIYFTKGFPWLAIIVALVLAAAILIISWRLLTYIGSVAPWAVPWVLLAGIAAVTVVGVCLVRRAT